ncbi:MAG: hypothetical protein LBQ66_11320, partial [Planctomycetaceae bacterium]|nr:hypothetical protein [Planctomycetaceae bacterium]
SGVVPIQTEHASTTIHGINVKINDSPEKMCGITRALPYAMSLLPFQGVDTANKRYNVPSPQNPK